MNRIAGAAGAALLMAALSGASPAGAQDAGSLAAACSGAGLPAALSEACVVAVQTAQSAQPQLALLLSGGNPTPGTASAGGLRLGLLPRVSAGVGVNVVFAELPDLLLRDAPGAVRRFNREVGVPVPALTGTATVGLLPGFRAAPTLGGIGSVDLIGAASWLPVEAFGSEGFNEESASFSYALGGRLGLLRESFGVPAVSLSLLYHRLDEISYGDVCAAQPRAPLGGTPALAVGACAAPGDAGEVAFDLATWSARGVVSKQLLGLGLAAGAGYDRTASDVAIGFRGTAATGTEQLFARFGGLGLESDRWLAFGNASFTALVATLAAEAGWMQGGDAVPGFQSLRSSFDPGEGTWFGSLNVRFAL